MNNPYYRQAYSQGVNQFQFNPPSTLQMKTDNVSSNHSNTHMYPNRGVSENKLQSSNLNCSKSPSPYSNCQSLKDQILSPNEVMPSEYKKIQFAAIRSNNTKTQISNSAIRRNKSQAIKQKATAEILHRQICYYLPSNSKHNKKTLLLDLDETLVHSAFKPFSIQADITLNVNVNHNSHSVHVLKRPYVDEFLRRMAQSYELVIFTASISQYANPLLDQLDKNQLITHRLFREHCVNAKGLYIKDLNRLGRDLKGMIILDNNPISYAVNQENGLPIPTWHNDKNDTELIKLIPLLEYLAYVDDVREFIVKGVRSNGVNFKYANELINQSRTIAAYNRQRNLNSHKGTKSIEINNGYYIGKQNEANRATKTNHANLVSNHHKPRTAAPSLELQTKDNHQVKVSQNNHKPKISKDNDKPFHQRANSCISNQPTNNGTRVGYESDFIPNKHYQRGDCNHNYYASPNISVNIVNNNSSNLCESDSKKEKVIKINNKETFNPFIIPKCKSNQKEIKKANILRIENGDSDSILTMDDNFIQESEHSRNTFHNSKSGSASIPNNYYCNQRSFSPKTNGLLPLNGNFIEKERNYYETIRGNNNLSIAHQTIERDKENANQQQQHYYRKDNAEYDNQHKENHHLFNQESPIADNYHSRERMYLRSPSPIPKLAYTKQQFSPCKEKQEPVPYYINKVRQIYSEYNQHRNCNCDVLVSSYNDNQGKINQEIQVNNYIGNNREEYQVNDFKQIDRNDFEQIDRNDFACNKRNYSQDWKLRRSYF